MNPLKPSCLLVPYSGMPRMLKGSEATCWMQHHNNIIKLPICPSTVSYIYKIISPIFISSMKTMEFQPEYLISSKERMNRPE